MNKFNKKNISYNLDKVCLIITGTIFPAKDIYMLAVKDPYERREQYRKCIRFFIEQSKVRNIVFCENSGASIDEELLELSRVYGKKFEWLSFSGDSMQVAEKGKGFGEGEIMNYALSHSAILKKCNYIIKVTGRLIVYNINFLLRIAKINENYFKIEAEKNIDTRFYMIDKQVYINNLQYAFLRVDDRNDYYLENSFYDSVYKKIKYCEFPIALDIGGISGSTGIVYRHSLFKAIFKTVYQWLRRLINRLG